MTDDGRGIERLLRMERMMTEAYDIALGKINDQRLVETLAALREHHRQCGETMQQVSQGSGGQGSQLDGTYGRYAEEVLGTVDDAVRRDEAIGELRIAEAALRMAYGETVQAMADRQVVETVKSCMMNEAEHTGVLAMAHATAKT